MQVNAPFRPSSRPHPDMSPASTGSSEWSGMNNYNGHPRPGGPFGGPPPRGDSMSPPDSNGPMDRRQPPFRGNTFGPGFSPTDPILPPIPRPGSRASSRAGSIAHSRSSDGTIADQQSRKYQRMEAELRQHYAVLRSYLKGPSSHAIPKNKARDKLLRLSPVQFHELSTDVFDELQRRQAAAPLPGRPPRGKVPPFLQPRREFHEKRNQARQKLSSLQTSRFRDLASDVFFELERRFPHFNPEPNRDSMRSQSRGPAGRPSGPNGFAPPPRAQTANGSMSVGPKGPTDMGNDAGRPMQKQFQSNTITPYKSTMVEDEDDEEGALSHYARSSDAFGLESALTSPRSGEGTSSTSMTGGSRDMKGNPPNAELHEKVFELEAKLQAKDDEIRQLSTGSKLKEELEHKLDDAERLNKSLQEELDRLQADHANMERDLRSQLSSAKVDPQDEEWHSKHDALQREHRTLRSRYEEQIRTTEEVSKQFKVHLSEMRAMAEDSGNNYQREEKLHHDVQKLQDELNEWKTRYAKAKTQLKSTRTSMLGLHVKQPEFGNAFYQSNGLVKDVNVTRFQIAIDELLKAARSEDPSVVLDCMKTVVMAVRAIIGDVDASSTEDKDEESSKRKTKLKSKVSATANNMITACKNFIAAGGLSPVSLLDAAVSHLTSAMVDLLRTTKIRPTPGGDAEELEESTLTPVNNAGYFDVSRSLRRKSATDSIYSALSDPPEDHQRQQPVMHNHSSSGVINGYANSSGLGITPGLQADETELEELKVYLGNQTDLMVQSVQDLVTSIRNGDTMPIIRNHISTIVDIAENVVGASEGAMEDASSFQETLTTRIYPIVDTITKCKDKLEHAGIESQRHDGQASAKQFSQSLPPLAFQIARELKELVSKTDGIVAGEQPADEDFS